MLDRRRDVNIAQGIVGAVLTVVSIGWGWLAYRNVADALRSGFRGLVVALFTTGLFIMVMGILCQAQGTARAAVRRRVGIKIACPRARPSRARLEPSWRQFMQQVSSE